ncbi:MAG: flavodoxin family protein [Anaerovoracaceae bacterium]
MKALLLNGSPRKGNIHTALESLKKGFSNIDGLSVSQIDATKVKVSCCIACEQCGKTKGCVFKDDTNKILDEIIDADILVFATPVYWWGISTS